MLEKSGKKNTKTLTPHTRDTAHNSLRHAFASGTIHGGYHAVTTGSVK